MLVRSKPQIDALHTVFVVGAKEYVVTRYHARVNFEHAEKTDRRLLKSRVEEAHYESGRWVFERLWHEDQTDYGTNSTSIPEVLHVVWARY